MIQESMTGKQSFSEGFPESSWACPEERQSPDLLPADHPRHHAEGNRLFLPGRPDQPPAGLFGDFPDYCRPQFQEEDRLREGYQLLMSK